jgi:hypothetical protein
MALGTKWAIFLIRKYEAKKYQKLHEEKLSKSQYDYSGIIRLRKDNRTKRPDARCLTVITSN